MRRREFILKTLLGAAAGPRLLDLPTDAMAARLVSGGDLTVLHNGIVLGDPFPPPLDRFMDGSQIPPYLADPPSVITINVGRQLFVDDFLIQSTSGVERTIHSAVLDSDPVLSPQFGDSSTFQRNSGETVVTHFAAPYSDGVWWDAYQKRYRAWLLSGRKALGLAESSDGAEWERVRTGTEPAIIMRVPAERDSGTVWIDFEAEDPAERYKMSHFAFTDKKNWLFASSDGVKWPEYDHPVSRTAHYAVDPGAPFGDRTTFFRDPFREKWVWSLRDLVDLRHAGGRRYHRVRRFAEADDLLRESNVTRENTPWLMQRFDLLPEILPQLYNVDAIAYESVLLFMLTIWTGDDFIDADTGRALPKANELHLGFSRDGFHVSRPDEGAVPFIGRGDPESWNEGNVQSVGGGLTLAGPPEAEVMFIYFTARENRLIGSSHIERWGHLGRARLRRDGFASIDAPAAGGTLTTRPLRFDHNDGYLFVNTEAAGGELRVEITDIEGHAFPGFGFQDCTPVNLDSTRHRVQWRENHSIGRLGRQPFRLRFMLTESSLYSFWVSPAPSGISNGFLAAGGPGYAGYRDDEVLSASRLDHGVPSTAPFALLSSTPNPFDDETLIRYRLDADLQIDLGLYDLLGRRLTTLVNERQSAGVRTIRLDGSRLASGVYVCRLHAADRRDTLRIVKS